MNAFFTKLNDTKKPKIADWLIVAVIMIFGYFSFNHSDLLITSTHGKDLVLCTLQGDFFGFYDYTQSTAVYSIIIYIFFAVWSLPVCLIYKLFGLQLWGVFEYGAIPFPVIMWYKLLPTLFFAATAVLLYKIAKEINMSENTSKWICFLFVSSPLAMFSQFIFGQYDSIGLFFTVLAFRCFLKKKYYAFSLWMALAITFKLFAFFAFIPLILLFEKRLVHIIKHFLLGISLYAITNLMFIGSPGFRQTVGFNGAIMSRLFEMGLSSPLGTISAFILAMAGICVYAYVYKCKNDNDYIIRSLFIPFAVFAFMFAFVRWHPQWLIYFVPFMCLAVLLTPHTNAVLIIESVMSVGFLGTSVLGYANNVDAGMLANGIFSKIYSLKNNGISIADNLLKTGQNMFFSLFDCAVLVLTGLCAAALFSKNEEQSPVVSGKYFAGDRIYLLARPLTLLLFIVPSIYLLFK